MDVPSYFRDFLKEIRLQRNHVEDLKRGHKTLRDRLLADERLAPIIVDTFLQGSYRRATANRPKGDKRADVDVVTVTKLNKDEYTPQKALEVFVPFLDKHYAGKYELQGRSIGIHLTYADLDIVVTAAPSESEIGVLRAKSVVTEATLEDVDDWRLAKAWLPPEERPLTYARTFAEAVRAEPEWKLSPLLIPDRDVQRWERTHPLAQMQWTWEKNARCNRHYVNVVKAIKWWRRVMHPTPKYPKGYPVEHLVGQCCPDGITSVAEGVTRTLEEIARQYAGYTLNRQTPWLSDHGVPEHNVFKRVSGKDFAAFVGQVGAAAVIARRALDADTVRRSANAWRELFGDKFPEPPPDEGGGDDDEGGDGPSDGGYTPRKAPTVITGGRYA